MNTKTPTIYLKKCKVCLGQTPHRVYNLSIKKGFRLQCLKCGMIQARYDKLNKLMAYDLIS